MKKLIGIALGLVLFYSLALAAVPAAINNLTATAPSVGAQLHVKLSWTSPANTPTSYDVRYRTDAVCNDANFGTATPVSYFITVPGGAGGLVSTEPAPQASGQSEMLIPVGLKPNTLYYWCIQSSNGDGTSTTSNSPSITTAKYEGGGWQSVGGGEKTIVEVSNTNDSGAGSLRAACSAGDRYIVFSAAGNINLQSVVDCSFNNVTLDGWTSSDPGITITTDQQGLNDGFRYGPCTHAACGATGDRSHQIIAGIRLLGLFDQDTATPPCAHSGCVDGCQGCEDLFGLIGTAAVGHHIVMDHCTIAHVDDAAADISGEVTDATYSFNYFFKNYHPILMSGKTSGGASSRISLHHNLFDRNGEREPKIDYSHSNVDLVNNVFINYDYDPLGTGRGYASPTYGTRISNVNPGGNTGINIINNWYIPYPYGAWVPVSNGVSRANAALIYGSSKGYDAEEGGPSYSGCKKQGSYYASSLMGQLWVAGNIFPAANCDEYSTVTAPIAWPAGSEIAYTDASFLLSHLSTGMPYPNGITDDERPFFTSAPALEPAGTTFHVAAGSCIHGSAACSDSNDGLSRLTPLCTLQAAINKLTPGTSDSIQVHTGTFTDDAEFPNWNDTGGASPTSPITIQGAPGDAPSGIILRGSTSQDSASAPAVTSGNAGVLRIAGSTGTPPNRIKNIRIKDLTVNPGNLRGIYINKASYIEIDNVDFVNWQGTLPGLCNSQGSGGACNSSAVVVATAADHLTLKNSSATNNGVQVQGVSGLQLTSGLDDVLIYNNVVQDFNGGCVHGSSSGSGHGRIAYINNDFRNCQGNTDEQSMLQSYNNQDTMIYGNLFVIPANGNTWGAISCRRTSYCSDSSSCSIIGNTIVNLKTSSVFGVRFNNPDAFTCRNNIFHGFDTLGQAYIKNQSLVSDCPGCPCTPLNLICNTFNEDYNYVYKKPPDQSGGTGSAAFVTTNGISNNTSSGCTQIPGPHTVVTSANTDNLDGNYVPNPGSPVVNTGDPLLGVPLGGGTRKDIGVFDLGSPGTFPQNFNPVTVTSSATPTIRWGGTPGAGDIVITPRNNPPITQAYYRVQIDMVPSFDSLGIWTPLIDTTLIPSTATSYTVATALGDGPYFVRVTLSDATLQKEQEWSDPFYRFDVSASRAPQTFYVDGSCPGPSGDGTTAACGATGPKLTIPEGIALLAVSGDVLEIRGERTGSTFDGIYSADYVPISNLDGGTDRFTIQPYHYLLPDAEQVHIESTKPLVTTPGHGDDGTGWSHCSWDGTACDCDAGHLNVCVGTSAPCDLTGQTACEETWWHTKIGDGSQNTAAFAITPAGGITPLRSSLAGMTSQYDAFNASPTILVRWGSSLPAKPWVNYSSQANGFYIGGSGPVSNLTIQGLDFRRIMRAALQIQPGNTNLIIRRNKFHLNQDAGGGSARPITADSSTNIQILDNELFYSQDEPLHMTTFGTGHFSGLIAGNWVHDIGAGLGTIPGGGGTPNCTTFTSDYTGNTTGDFSGLIVENNLFQRCRLSDGTGKVGILFEAHCDGMNVRNNYIQDVGTGVKWAPDGGVSPHASNAQVYGNIIETVTSAGGGKAACFHMATDGGAIAGNKTYNNTCINATAGGIVNDGSSTAALTGNIFRNNLFFDNRATWLSTDRLINWSAPGSSQTNSFQNNLLWPTASTGTSNVMRIGATTFNRNTCDAGGDVDGDAATDSNKCRDPLWEPFDPTAHDYRLRSNSPAIDAGTMNIGSVGAPVNQSRTGINFTNGLAGPQCSLTGLPCDINGACPDLVQRPCIINPETGICEPKPGTSNVCTNPSGLPDYSRLSDIPIASAPDIGAWESMLADGGFETGSIDGPWFVPIADFSYTVPPAQSATISPLKGSRSLHLNAYPALEGFCFGCRARWIHQTVTGLSTSRRYTLSGAWSLISGIAGSTARVDFGFRDPNCDLTDPYGCITIATCSAQIGGSGPVSFICPSFVIPSGSSIDIIIVPVWESGAAEFVIDNLDLR